MRIASILTALLLVTSTAFSAQKGTISGKEIIRWFSGIVYDNSVQGDLNETDESCLINFSKSPAGDLRISIASIQRKKLLASVIITQKDSAALSSVDLGGAIKTTLSLKNNSVPVRLSVTTYEDLSKFDIAIAAQGKKVTCNTEEE